MTNARRAGGWFAGILLLELCAPQEGAHAELWGPHSRFIQDGPGGELQGSIADFDALGRSLAVGDFDGDGKDDLAIGENESESGFEQGIVHVLFGSGGGFRVADGILADFDPASGLSDNEPGDDFGWALVAGNFNGDSFDDLAIGIPGENIAGPDCGAVLVLYGAAGGLSGGARRFRLGGGGVGAFAEAGDRFGATLSAGDFDDDGHDDLVIGMPWKIVGVFLEAGRVLVLYGGASGLSATGHRFFSQDSSGTDGVMQDSAEFGDRFGSSFAVGDFNHDSIDDLAIGAPNENIGAVADVGVVHVLYGFVGAGPRGLRLTNNQAWNEGNVDAEGFVEAGDRFGFALAAGDLTGDGTDDLAVGAPGEDIQATDDCGAVTLLLGQPGVGIHPAGSELYDQSDLEDGESRGAFDNFGVAFAIGDFVDSNPLGGVDLAIGVVQEDTIDMASGAPAEKAGGVAVVAGGAGLDTTRAVFWAEGYRGSVRGQGETPAHHAYGFAVAGGDFDGNGEDDLAVGAILDWGTLSTGEVVPNGAVYVLFGALFADGFETGDSNLWSATAP